MKEAPSVVRAMVISRGCRAGEPGGTKAQLHAGDDETRPACNRDYSRYGTPDMVFGPSLTAAAMASSARSLAEVCKFMAAKSCKALIG